MIDYESMSDFEINRKVAEYFYCPNWLSRHAEKAGMIPDYCNNPSDAWPIIEEVWERLMQVDSYYQAHTRWEAYCIEHGVGKLRAAMICFLKMNEADE